MAQLELTVTWEDQKRINDFSVLVSRCEQASAELSRLQREGEATEDALKELELILDEDEPIMMRCGTGFNHVPYDKVVQRLRDQQQSRERKMADLRAKLGTDEERCAILKRVLQSKFGDAIQLEL